MMEFGCFSVLLVLCGPVALIISLIVLGKVNKLSERMKTDRLHSHITERGKEKKTQIGREQFESLYKTPEPGQAAAPQEEAVVTLQPEPVPSKPVQAPPVPAFPKGITHKKAESALLEQQIGIRWLLIAGVITVFIAVAFFLKYAYENWSIGPLGQLIAIIIIGLVALVVGEITRRREYDIVAKGTTALGFAILYAADCAANGIWFHDPPFLQTTTAFALAVIITAAAMIYAVCLDEVLIAFLALLGSFLTPVLVSTEQNLPVHLFSYTLILSLGAMACAYYRKWPAVNLLAFAGTFALYTGWFEKFYHAADAQSQMPVALTWLAIFFFVYLIMPILHGLVKKINARKQDELLVVANAFVTFYYLWQILYDSHRPALAMITLLLSAVHLIAMFIVFKRCFEDRNLRIVLLAVALLFVTIAAPLYFEFNALSMTWACQAVVLALIGIRYKSSLTQAFAAVAILLSSLNLLDQPPIYEQSFRFILNPTFGTWVFVAAAAYIYHLLYRCSSRLDRDTRDFMAQLFYALMGILFLAAASMEWYSHCLRNLENSSVNMIAKGQMIIFALLMLLFVIRPLCPKGMFRETLAVLLAAAGSVTTVVTIVTLHRGPFTILANIDFAFVLIFIAVLALCHIFYRLLAKNPQSPYGIISQTFYAAIGGLLFLALTAEWLFHCEYNLPPKSIQFFLRNQTLIFALAVLFFVIRPLCPEGFLSRIFAVLVALFGSAFTLIAFYWFYDSSFIIFLNLPFIITLLFVLALAASGLLLYRLREDEPDAAGFAVFFGLSVVFILWLLITEQIWYYFLYANIFTETLPNWKFLAHMYISIAWAVYGALLMVVGFWRNIKILRYLALALFAILLFKVFLWDTRTVKQVYRIAAFFATGLTLVGVSYLYQFFKKKGFFDSMMPAESKPDPQPVIKEKETDDD
jgi:uncharacterized membrane protein